jgi:DNA repair protein RadC
MKTYKTNINLYTLRKIQTEFPKVKVDSSATAAKFIKQFYSDDIEVFESFFVLLLNSANITTGYAKISQGGLAGTVVDTRLIAKYAVDALAPSVILAHNHPSGNTRPSHADREITKKIIAGLGLLDIKVLDHLILTEESFLSFADEGLL